MKKIIVLGLLAASLLWTVACTCSREKEQKSAELETLSACTEQERAAGTCGERKGEKPRTLKINPRQLTLNRELLNRAFTTQKQGSADQPQPSSSSQPEPGSTATTRDESVPASQPSNAAPLRPAMSSKAAKIPIVPRMVPSEEKPENGGTQ